MDRISLYVDGACRNNQSANNIGAIGIVLKFNNNIKELSEAYKNTTNNRMEILAAIRGLEALKRVDIPIDIFTDSQYLVNTINQNWNKNKNTDLWDTLESLISKFEDVNFFWVKGHDKDIYNIAADRLCNEAMDNYKE